MNRILKKSLRQILPPVLWEIAKPKGKYGFFGDYPTWSAAKAECSGYDAPLILEKVRLATRAVRDGKAVYERDSVLFDAMEYNWPLLALLLRIAALKQNRLRVLDFGGSLGSTYTQCRSFLSGVETLEWSVVEQANFVAAGKEFENGELRFFPDIETCLKTREVDCLLVSSVLPYLERPDEFIGKVQEFGFDFILIDRTPFIFRGRDRIVVQRVPPEIYPASYPAWLFDYRTFSPRFGKYAHVFEFEGFDKMNIEDIYKGILFERRV